MFDRSEVSWNRNTVLDDLSSSDEVITWSKDDPIIEFVATSQLSAAYEGYSSYSIMEHQFSNYEYDPVTEETEETPVTDYDCPGHFKHTDNYDYLICPNFTDFKLGGEYNNQQLHKTIEGMIVACSGPSNEDADVACASETIQQQIWEGTTLNIHMNNKYVDLDDIENPIKNYTERTFESFFEWGVVKKIEITIRRNEVVLEDKFFTLTEPDPVEFFSIGEMKSTSQSTQTGHSGWFIVIKLGNKIDQHRRSVLSFLEVTGTLGGIFEIFEICVGFLIGIISSFSFRRSLEERLTVNDAKYESMNKMIQKLERKLEYLQNNDRNQEEEKQMLEGGDEEEPLDGFKRYFTVKPRQRKVNNEKENDENVLDKKDAFNHLKENIKTVGDFEKSLDCVDIVFTLKCLSRKVDYLLAKDNDFQSEYDALNKDQLQDQAPEQNLTRNIPKVERIYEEAELGHIGLPNFGKNMSMQRHNNSKIVPAQNQNLASINNSRFFANS